MARHLLVALVVSGLATALVAGLAVRLGEARTARNFAIAGAVVVASVTAISTTSNTLVRPCLDNPAEDCEYNDGVSSVAVLTAVYALVCGLRAWFLYSER